MKEKLKDMEKAYKNLKTENRKKDAEIKHLKDETNQLNIKIDDLIKANDKKEKSCQVCEKTCLNK